MSEIETLLREARPRPSDRVAARAMDHRQVRRVPSAVRRAGWAAAAMIALLLGLFVGGAGPDREDGPDHVMTAAFDSAGAIDVD